MFEVGNGAGEQEVSGRRGEQAERLYDGYHNTQLGGHRRSWDAVSVPTHARRG